MASSFTACFRDFQEKYQEISFPSPFTGECFLEMKRRLCDRVGVADANIFWKEPCENYTVNRQIGCPKDLDVAIEHALRRAKIEGEDPWMHIVVERNLPGLKKRARTVQERTEQQDRPPLVHEGVSCEGCNRPNFPGLRFKCKKCFDFGLCEECYKADRFDQDPYLTRTREHPMKRIELSHSNGSSVAVSSYRTVAACDYCNENGFLLSEYSEHLRKNHKEPQVHEKGNVTSEVDCSFKKMLTELWYQLKQREAELVGKEKAINEREKAVGDKERVIRAREDVVAMEKTHALAIYEKTSKTEIALKCWQSDLEELEAWAKDREQAVAAREVAVAEKEARWRVEKGVDKTTLLPSRWNHGLSHVPDLRFTYPLGRGGWLEAIGSSRGHIEPVAARADRPCPLDVSIYYFEVRVVRSDGFMGIGLTKESVSLRRLPGWDPESYGYHGDDGTKRAQPVKGIYTGGLDYGPLYGTGDVVGCALHVMEKTVFFTKNGVNLGTAFTITEPLEGFYPTIGLQMRGAVVEANFGQKSFVYDIAKDIEAAEALRAEVESKNAIAEDSTDDNVTEKDDENEEDEKEDKKDGKNEEDEEQEINKSDASGDHSMADLYGKLREGKCPIIGLKIILAVKYLEAYGMNKSDIQQSVAIVNKRNEDLDPDNVKRLIKDLELVMERIGMIRGEAIRVLLEGNYEVDNQGRVLEQNNTYPNIYRVVEGNNCTAVIDDPSETEVVICEKDVDLVMQITRCDRDWAARAILRNNGDVWLAAKDIVEVQEAREAAAKMEMISPPILDDVSDDEDHEEHYMGGAKKQKEEKDYDSDASYENIDMTFGPGNE